MRQGGSGKEAFNSAYDDYKERGANGREETAHKVAWTAVKKKYQKDEKTGKWHEAS
ncbi:ChaB family protein [Massilia cavernae]|uniref:ChaB family protein n=1 Tax=Massilia cavernae TaxID=2320864 RepID=UPI001E5555E8|nr:ChaB family protein [Massilia cavernae]